MKASTLFMSGWSRYALKKDRRRARGWPLLGSMPLQNVKPFCVLITFRSLAQVPFLPHAPESDLSMKDVCMSGLKDENRSFTSPVVAM